VRRDLAPYAERSAAGRRGTDDLARLRAIECAVDGEIVAGRRANGSAAAGGTSAGPRWTDPGPDRSDAILRLVQQRRSEVQQLLAQLAVALAQRIVASISSRDARR
jgi:hypothetical protein